MSPVHEASTVLPPSPGPARPVFRLTARLLDGGVRELKVEGELDLAVADRLGEQIAVGNGRAVLVDLSDCTFIDSTAIAVVLLARRDGERVAIHSPSEQVHRILEITGLTRDGIVFAGRREAIAGLRAEAGDS